MKMPFKILIFQVICCSSLLISQSYGDPCTKKESICDDKKSIIGSSIENPIILKKIDKYSQIKEVQRKYIDKQYSNYYIAIEIFTMDKNGRSIQFFVLRDDEGHTARIYFDLTDTYKRLSKSRDKKTRDKIRELEDSHKPKEQ